MDQRVYLHVGLPKSGTTFLQASLLRNRQALRQAGVLFPAGEERMFQAAVDVRGNHKAWGLARSEVKDGWDAILGSSANLVDSPWNKATKFPQWKSETATPAYQEFLAGKIDSATLQKRLTDGWTKINS